MPTEKIYLEQIEDGFVLKSIYDIDMAQKANIDGSNTIGGVWFIDTVLSDKFPNYKQVLTALSTKEIEYGNVELINHRFLVNNINGIKIKVGNQEGIIWNSLNFDPATKANTDGSNATGSLASTIANNHTHTNKSVLDGINASLIANWNNASANAHTHANKALLDTYNQTNANITDAVNLRHSHANKTVLDATTAPFTTALKTKLDNLSNYILPIASATVLGGVMVGAGLSIDVNGVLSNSAPNIVQILNLAGQNLSLSSGGGSVVLPFTDWNNIPNKPTTFTPSAHNHIIADVTGLQGALNNKSDLGHTHAWSEITGKPSTFTPSAHVHASSDVNVLTGYVIGANVAISATDSLNAALGKIQAQINSKTNNVGTVTSIGLSVPTGLSVSNSPITTNGIIGLSYASGYQGYTTAEANKLASLQNVTSGDHINVSANKVNVVFEDGNWVKDSQGFNRLRFGGTVVTDDILIRGKYNGSVDFKIQDALGANFLELQSGGSLRINNLVSSTPRMLFQDGTGSIFNGHEYSKLITSDNINGFVPTNFITTNTNQTGLIGDKTSSGKYTVGALRVDSIPGSSVFEQPMLELWDRGTANGNIIPIAFNFGNTYDPNTFIKVYSRGTNNADGGDFQFWSNNINHTFISNAGILTTNQIRKAGQNDTQMLLAGGGHRPVSDFALASSLGSFLPLSGGTMVNASAINWSSKGLLTIGGLNRIRFTDANTIISGNNGSIYFRPTNDATNSNEVVITNIGQINTPLHGNSRQWEQAYDWGDHALAGYALASSVPAQVNIIQGSGITVSGTYPNLTISNSEPNVQSDWNATNGSAQILNKPTIPTYSGSASIIQVGTSFQRAALSGDVTALQNSNTVTLVNSGVVAGTYNNNAAQVRPFTVDAKGRVTNVGAAVPIVIPIGNVTNLQTNLNTISNRISSIEENVLETNFITSVGGFVVPIKGKKTIINVSANVMDSDVFVADAPYVGYELAINGCSEYRIHLHGALKNSCQNNGVTTITKSSLFWWDGSFWVQAI